MIERITSLSQNKITHNELVVLNYKHKIFDYAFLLEAFEKLLSENKSEDIADLCVGLKQYLNQGRRFSDEIELLFSKNIHEGIQYLIGLSQLPDALFSDKNICAMLYKNASHVNALAIGLRHLFLYRFHDQELYKKHLNFLLLHPEKAHECASMLVVLHQSKRDIYEKICRLGDNSKLNLLLAFYILFQREEKHYNAYYEKHIHYLFTYPEYAIEIARGFSRLGTFHHFSENIQLLILNPMLASYRADLIAELATDKNVKIYEIFTEQSATVADDLLKSIEMLKKNHLYHIKRRNFLLKYPFYAVGIASALCYLNEKHLLGIRGKALLEKDPKHAMQIAKAYVLKRLQKIKIDRTYLDRNEDLYLFIPKLLSPYEYEDSICIALGGALMNALVQHNVSNFLNPVLLKRMGVFFINCVNQTTDTLENNVMEDLYYIVNYKAYHDPDREAEKLDKEKLKNKIDEKFAVLLNDPNPLIKYHQILSITANALHLTLPELEQVSLLQWQKIYFYIAEKLDNYQLKSLSLQSFFKHIDEIKIQNKEIMKEISIKLFKDFSPAELLNLAKLVQLFDKKYDEEKKKCMFAIQTQLASTKEGLVILKGLFAKSKTAKETQYKEFDKKQSNSSYKH